MPQALPAVRRYTIGGSTFEAPPLPPGLYLVATPIGNLRDVTIRALETLASVDLLYCEDTRITSRLLTRYGIAKPLKPYHDHNAAKVRPVILAALRAGGSVAFASDAGTPLISDPGYKLVRAAIAENFRVEMMPGPSAPIMALALSGLPVDRFFFAGFLPAKRGEKLRFLQELDQVRSALIFFDAPGRLAETLKTINAALGDRTVAVARELTKLHEEILRGSPDEIVATIEARGGLKGEITIVVAPPAAAGAPEQREIETALAAALEYNSPARAASLVARQFALPRKQLYDLAVKMKTGQGEERGQ